MKDPIKQLLAALMASHLDTEIAEYEANEGGATWMRTAARALSPADHKALVDEAKRLRAKYRKDAAGCPANVFRAREFFDRKALKATAGMPAQAEGPAKACRKAK